MSLSSLESAVVGAEGGILSPYPTRVVGERSPATLSSTTNGKTYLVATTSRRLSRARKNLTER
jgi:hypothetical protein